MNSLRMITGLLSMACLLGGCTNPVARSYVSSGMRPTQAPAVGADCVIRETKDLAQEAVTLRTQGWAEVGRSAYTDSGKLNFSQVEAQAKKVGAALVLWRGWVTEDKLDEASGESPVRPVGRELPGEPGASSNPPRQLFAPSSGPYKVTVYHYEIVFWRR